jgi:hypothetical protein
VELGLVLEATILLKTPVRLVLFPGIGQSSRTITPSSPARPRPLSTRSPSRSGVVAKVQGHQPAPVVAGAQVGEHITVSLDRLVGARREGRAVVAQAEQAAVEGEHRAGIVALGGHVHGRIPEWQPRPSSFRHLVATVPQDVR